MAIVYAEHFRKYSAIADLAANNDDLNSNVWTNTGMGLTTSTGRFGQTALDATGTASLTRFRLGAANIVGSTMIVSAHLKWNNIDTVSQSQLSPLMAIGSTVSQGFHAVVCIGPGGTLSLSRNHTFSVSRNLLAARVATSSARLSSGVWHHLEMKVSLLDAGTATVRLDGVQIMTASADFLASTTTLDSVYLGGIQQDVFWEDLLVMDGSGATFNDFMGDFRIETALPDADGATANWTASAGSRFQTIDDALPLASANYDTDYISSATTDQVNLSSHANIVASGATAIWFAGVEALARADAAGDKLALRVFSGATGLDSADKALINGTYRWRQRIYTVDPNTSAAWTVANVNSAEWGIKKRV